MNLSEAMNSLVGAPLLTVEWIEDYAQIQIGKASISILNKFQLLHPKEAVSVSDEELRARVEACARATLRSVEISPIEMRLVLSNGWIFSIDLKIPDAGGEVLVVHAPDGQILVV